MPGVLHGWRVGVTVCAITAGAVFIVNTIATIWAVAKFGASGGIGIVQDGSCSKIRTLSTWLHIIINVLSTLLLSASNYTTQCISSPTRDEVDRAHKRNIYMDIGVPSMRNLRLIAWNRIILWWLLALSGIPLHLLYNSAVFSTLFVQDHTVYALSDNLLGQNSSNWPKLNSSLDPFSAPHYNAEHFQDLSTWDTLQNDNCMKSYSKRIVSDRGDVLVVTRTNNTLLAIADTYELSGYCLDCDSPYAWMCYDYQSDRRTVPGMDYSEVWCDPNTLIGRKQYTNWTVSSVVNGSDNFPVQYCLSQPIDERCKLQFSLVIMMIVIICNFTKSLCMIIVSGPFPATRLG